MSAKISDQLRRAIESAGISRYELAKRTGVDAGLLSRFVRAKCNLSLPTIDRVCECLGLEVRAVKGKQPTTTKPATARKVKKAAKSTKTPAKGR